MSPLCYVGGEMACLRNTHCTPQQRDSGLCNHNNHQTWGVSCPHRAAARGWGGGEVEGKKAGLAPGGHGMLFLPGLEAPAGRLWGEWAGAGAKGPERQMSPISVLSRLA